MPNKKYITINPIMAIVCDDVRDESNGKQMLIGIYTGNISVSSVLPKKEDADKATNLNVYIWIPFEVAETGDASVEIQIVGPNPHHIIRAKMEMNIPKMPRPTEVTPIVLGPIPLNIWQDGEIQILFKNDSDKGFRLLRNIPVKFTALELDPRVKSSSVEIS